MFSCTLLVASFFTLAMDACGPRLNGAFVQLDGTNETWTAEHWRSELARMRAAKLGIVIVQYLEARGGEPATSEEYVPAGPGGPDPLKAILDDADRHGMKVFVGLRYDARLLGSKFLNTPNKLRSALADELARNTELAARVTERYQLKTRASFAGWYLPVEFANFREDLPGEEKGWITQLSKFTRDLVAACKAKVNKDVAVSPYFNGKKKEGKLPKWLVGPEDMEKNTKRFLQNTGVSIVMLQDGVGVGKIPTAEVEAYVKEYLLAVKRACSEASPPHGPRIRFWLNVESIGADMNRLGAQMALGVGNAEETVTFDFPHHLGRKPLYEEYVKYLAGLRVPPPHRLVGSCDDYAVPSGLFGTVEGIVRAFKERD